MSRSNAAGWLSGADPLDVFAWLVGIVMLVIAMAQWLASFRADRRALRIFAVRYAASAPGWWFAHPDKLRSASDVPLGSALVGVALLGVTVWALHEFLAKATTLRRTLIAAGTLVAALVVVLYSRWKPNDPAAIYGVMLVAMSLCAVVAAQAAREEPGVGHGVVAAAFASYPVALVLGAVSVGWHGRANLSYFVALPAVCVGITILAVSLARAAIRAQLELQRREVAEARLAELNASLEMRVADRTGELQLLVDGLESFTRNVSHDLRGSLGGTAGLSRLALDALAKGDAAAAQRMLEAVAPQLEHLAALVRDLLLLTRVGDDHLVRSMQPLEPLVRQAIEQLELEPESRAALARTQLEIGTLPSLAVDGTLLRQVFVNLLANAIRFASGGESPKVWVGHAAAGPSAAAAIYVKDNGLGFEPAASGELFRPFVKLHPATLSRHGIGLSIVRRIIERHGGRVWAEGQPGAGAVFWFDIGHSA
jgi:signal transduction histidine kinase